MRLQVSFAEDERVLILKIAEMVKALFPGTRMHPPKPGDDGQFHMSMNSPKH